jgi:ribosome-associated translation inhibitor RaiA
MKGMPTPSHVIEVSGLDRAAPLSAKLRSRLRRVLATLNVAPVRARIDFHDDNGPKGGPALRCALTARLPYQRPIRVEAVDLNARGAFDRALERLERRLERYRERPRDARRRPKKYYVARRLVWSGGEETTSEPG